MRSFSAVLLFCFTWSFCFTGTHQLLSSQKQVLLQLRKHLEYPQQLEIWSDHRKDFCSLSSFPQVNISCENDVVTELRILGDKPGKVGYFTGFAVPNRTLSVNFSVDSFFTTLTRLTSLKVLSLVSVGIWGPLPDKIHRLSSLQYLDLSSNYFFGSIPPKISTMVQLQTLKLDHNFFNGTSGKSPDLSDLSSLQVLDLSGNRINSRLPSLPKGLVRASLSNNSFWGDIPSQYDQLSHLQYFDVSFNTIGGIPLATLFSLSNISYLSFASNKLGGSLPKHLSCGSKLEFVDISSNMLTGGLPSCLKAASDKGVVKLDGNCLSIGITNQKAKSYCEEARAYHHEQSRGKNVGVLVGLTLGTFVLVVFLAFGAITICRRYSPGELQERHLLQKAGQENSAARLSFELLNSARFVSQAAKLSTPDFPACRSFSLEEIREVTSNFNPLSLIGEGSYGKLYKGRLQSGTKVVIRCLSLSKKYSIRNLKLRLDLLGKLRHRHLVCLLGYCIDTGGRDDFTDNKIFLVSEYVSNGSFRAHLFDNNSKKVLTWSERLAILMGVAKAVHFLHTGVIPGFFNNRLKAKNILLDENRMAKLSDYGLSIIISEHDRSVGKAESPISWQMLNLEDDVCRFGYIILEALVSPAVSARREDFTVTEMASLSSEDGQRRLVHPTVLATCSQESLHIVISIMNKCVSPESSRPSVEDVLWNLEYAAQVHETANHDWRSDTASYR